MVVHVSLKAPRVRIAVQRGRKGCLGFRVNKSHVAGFVDSVHAHACRPFGRPAFTYHRRHTTHLLPQASGDRLLTHTPPYSSPLLTHSTRIPHVTGRTAYDLARRRGHDAVAQLLKDAADRRRDVVRSAAAGSRTGAAAAAAAAVAAVAAAAAAATSRPASPAFSVGGGGGGGGVRLSDSGTPGAGTPRSTAPAAAAGPQGPAAPGSVGVTASPSSVVICRSPGGASAGLGSAPVRRERKLCQRGL